MTVATSEVILFPLYEPIRFSQMGPGGQLPRYPQSRFLKSRLLTETLRPALHRWAADCACVMVQDCGICWNLTGAVSAVPISDPIAPEWFYVPDAPPTLDATVRRSYVIWKDEGVPFIVLEFVLGSSSGSTTYKSLNATDTFWQQEHKITYPTFYGVYERATGNITVYHLVNGQYEQLPANERSHYPIAELAVELGIWHGYYLNVELPWLRWWDAEGNLLLTMEERIAQEWRKAEAERQRQEQERLLVEQERQRMEHLAALLRSLNVDPNQEG